MLEFVRETDKKRQICLDRHGNYEFLLISAVLCGA
jgi:hypothetical protein